ncbi:CD63 antigen-like [Leptopilina heterotoma]|uniref:CD63 antigen-like n=1 Tax=Leptopilina heterotoma TaxID=63436 RepID=UPI001CA8F618|nr:CD63 antigen-like [Leptopilina heterotoma]
MVSTMKLPLTSQCIKYLMFAFNLIFVITGIILLSIGSVILGVYNNYEHFLDNKFLSVPTLLVTIGAIIFFIAFFGCCGAVRENYCMVVTFATLMIVVFILELSGGISGYVLRNRAIEVIEGKMNHTMEDYGKNKEMSIVWDNLQTNFDCCGMENYKDWEKIWKNNSLPRTCCDYEPGASGNISCLASNSINSKVKETGCLNAFGNFVKGHAVQLGGAGIGIAFVQILGIWFSIILAKSIRSSYETV